MNRVRKIARLWVTQRPEATRLADKQRRKRNAERQPKPAKNPIKL